MSPKESTDPCRAMITKILLHLQYVLQNGSNSCLLRTVDTDILVIITGKFHTLLSWCRYLDFSTGKHFTYYHFNKIATALGKEECVALPTFHSFTGYDTISAIFGKGKLSVWAASKCYHAVTEADRYIAEKPFVTIDMTSNNFKLLELFTVVMYGRTSQLSTVDETRRALFCHRDRIISWGLGLDSLQRRQDMVPLLDHSDIWNM